MPEALIMPIGIKINSAIYHATLNLDPDLRVVVRGALVATLLDRRLIKRSDVPEKVLREVEIVERRRSSRSRRRAA